MVIFSTSVKITSGWGNRYREVLRVGRNVEVDTGSNTGNRAEAHRLALVHLLDLGLSDLLADPDNRVTVDVHLGEAAQG